MSKALNICYLSMASSISMVMQNAATNQKFGQTIGSTDLAVVCSLIIAKGAATKK